MRYVAFLRAINVGGHTVAMAALRTLFEEMGFENVSTFIASGNVLFESSDEDARGLERAIEERLGEALGYEVGTFLRTPEELQAVAAHPPFDADAVTAARGLYVCFLPRPIEEEAARRANALSTPTDDLRVRDRELYWLCQTGLSESTITLPSLARALGVPSTMRKITTVRRILAKLT